MKTEPTPQSLDSLIERYNRELMQYYHLHADRTSEAPPPKEADCPPAVRAPAPSRYAGRSVDDLLEHEFPMPEPYIPQENPSDSKRFSYVSPEETPVLAPPACVSAPPSSREENVGPAASAICPPITYVPTQNRESVAQTRTAQPETEEVEAPPSTASMEMSVGYLQVQVTSAREALPIAEALVTVSRITDKGEELYIHTITDLDGLTAVYPLPAVDSSLTLEPGIPSPYTSYNIEVSAPGFFRVFHVNAPLYGGNTALQPIQLIPLPEFELSPQDLVFFQTGPQDL